MIPLPIVDHHIERHILIYSFSVCDYVLHCLSIKIGMNDDFFTELVITLLGTFDEVNKRILEHMEKVKYDVLNSIYFEYHDVPLLNTSSESKNMDEDSTSINICSDKSNERF